MGQVSYRVIGGPDGRLAILAPFVGNSMSGEARPAYVSDGRLYLADDLDALREARAVGIRYVVRSYRTPIAWVREDGAVYHVRGRWSVTSSRHQGQARAWLAARVCLAHGPYRTWHAASDHAASAYGAGAPATPVAVSA